MAANPKYKIIHAKALNRNAITALELRLEHHVLIAANTDANRNKPMYEPMMAPLSISPVEDKEWMVITYNKVGIKAVMITTSIAKYFPKTICQLVRGLVCKVSKVPLLNSSAKLRMAKAGIKKINTQGARSKNALSVAYPKSKILLSFNTKRYNAFTIRNKIIVIYPVRLLKNWCNSFLAINIMIFKKVQFKGRKII